MEETEIQQAEEPEYKEQSLLSGDSMYIQNDFVPDSELKTIMYQYNPLAMKDIHSIEKGVEHFFKFNQSHYALMKQESLVSLQPADIDFLKEKNILTTFEYIEFQEDSRKLVLKKALIRPASLKAEQANKAIISCLRGSAVAILNYIAYRDEMISELQEKNQLKDWVFKKFILDKQGNQIDFNDKKNLPRLLDGIMNLSFELEIEKIIPIIPETFGSLIRLLSKRNYEILEELSSFQEIPEKAQRALQSRGDLSILTKYTHDFHLIQPSLAELVDITGEKFKEINSEIDFIFYIFVEMARKILLSMLPVSESSWIEKSGTGQSEKYYEELKKHKSFTNGDEWKNADEFLYILKKLDVDYNHSKKIRNDSRLEYVVNENLKHLNMKYELYNMNLGNFEIDDSVIKSFKNSKEEAFMAVVERIKSNRNILYKKAKLINAELSQGLTMIYKENVIQAFIKNKNTRNLINLIAKQNGYAAGIYDFLIPVTSEDPKEIVDVQINLSKAIDEWIKDLEKERIKKENAAKPLAVRIVEFILALFGIQFSAPKKNGANTKMSEYSDVNEEDQNVSKEKKKSIGVIVGPREKKLVIPGKIQKAIEYTERNNKGLIWVDEVLNSLGSPQYTEAQIGDYLFYDRSRRYLEIRAMNNVRHVFIEKEKENDPQWVKSTIDYLQNMASHKKEYKVLAEILRLKIE